MSSIRGEAWNAIREGNSIVEGLIAQKHYKEAMINARGTLQTMVTDLCERNGIETRNLVDMINELNEQGIIDDTTYQHYNKIRMLGNRAVNDDDNSAYNAQQAHHLLSQEIFAYANMISGRNSGGQDDDRPARPVRTSDSGRSAGAATAAGAKAAAGTKTTAGTKPAAGAKPAAGTKPAAGAKAAADGTGARPAKTGAGRISAGDDSFSPDIPFEKKQSGTARRTASGQGLDEDRPRRTPSAAQRSGRTAQRNISRGPAIDPGSIIKPLLLLAIIIVLIIIVRLIKPAKPVVPETEAPVTVEETTEPETTEPETTAAPAPVMVKTTDRVRLRATPSTDDANNVLATVDAGTILEFVRDENEEWAVVAVNGAEVYVSKQYITPAD